jgi:hypothetical protein
MTMRALVAQWVVRGGVVPGVEVEEYRRAWVITSDAWDPLDDEGRLMLFDEQRIRAAEYARQIQHPGRLNWVTLEWMWI